MVTRRVPRGMAPGSAGEIVRIKPMSTMDYPAGGQALTPHVAEEAVRVEPPEVKVKVS